MRAVKSLDFAKFPVKFPVSREFGGETGAISTASPARQSAFPLGARGSAGKARQQRAFVNLPLVSNFPFGRFGRANRQKSPAVLGNIPVFRRLRPETWFDLSIFPKIEPGIETRLRGDHAQTMS